MSSHLKFFLVDLPDTDEERDVIHGTLHSQIRIGLSSSDYLSGVPCRIEKERRWRGQLCKCWLTVHRRGERTRRTVFVEAQFPIKRSTTRRAVTRKLFAGHEIHDRPLSAVVTD